MKRQAMVASLAAVAWLVLAAASSDPRSQELLDLDCASQVAQRRLTLFANGTLRLRERAARQDEVRMRLAELTPTELAAYLNRLAAEDLSEVDTREPELSGDWVETCRLVLALPERSERALGFGRLDTLPLPLARLLAVIDDLVLEVELGAPRSRLPVDYEPRAGDRLRRFDGSVFEVVAFTADEQGVELLGLDQPLVLYISRAALRDEFDLLLERRP